jgi:hypothetical protein
MSWCLVKHRDNFTFTFLNGCETWSFTRREAYRFGPKLEDVVGDCRRLRNEELNDIYISPHIISVIKSRGMRWVGHEAHGRDEKCVQNLENLKRRHHSEDLRVDGRKILECILVKCDGLGASGSGLRPVASPCEYDNESSVP